MGSKPSSSSGSSKPKKPVSQPTQSLQTQTALAEVSGAQERLNMTLGSVLDQRNKEFFTTQDIRQTQATGAEYRLGLQTAGEQERAGIVASGEQQRLGYVTQGEQERLTQGQRYAGEKMLTETRGTEERKTLLQNQMENRYIAQRNYDWAQRAYKV